MNHRMLIVMLVAIAAPCDASATSPLAGTQGISGRAGTADSTSLSCTLPNSPGGTPSPASQIRDLCRAWNLDGAYGQAVTALRSPELLSKAAVYLALGDCVRGGEKALHHEALSQLFFRGVLGDDPGARAASARALSRMDNKREAAIEALFRLLDDEVVEVRATAARSLRSLKAAEPRVEKALLDGLVAIEETTEMSRFARIIFAHAYVDLFGLEDIGSQLALMKGSNRDVFANALVRFVPQRLESFLGERSVAQQDALRFMIDYLLDPGAELKTRRETLRALGLLLGYVQHSGSTDDALRDAIESVADDPDEMLRSIAADVLAGG